MPCDAVHSAASFRFLLSQIVLRPISSCVVEFSLAIARGRSLKRVFSRTQLAVQDVVIRAAVDLRETSENLRLNVERANIRYERCFLSSLSLSLGSLRAVLFSFSVLHSCCVRS